MPEDCGHHSVTYFSVIIINYLICALVYFCGECFLFLFCFVFRIMKMLPLKKEEGHQKKEELPQWEAALTELLQILLTQSH